MYSLQGTRQPTAVQIKQGTLQRPHQSQCVRIICVQHRLGMTQAGHQMDLGHTAEGGNNRVAGARALARNKQALLNLQLSRQCSRALYLVKN